MPLSHVTSDPEALTITSSGEYPVPLERLWKAWSDPRLLERFWGPPDWPCTFVRHDMEVGGRSAYYMSGPEGEVMWGYWDFLEVEEGVRFLVRDGFSDDQGHEDDELPQTRMEVRFEATETGSRFVCQSRFASLEAMEALLAMGALEGYETALAQMDDVLADLHATLDHPTSLRVLDDDTVLVQRVVRGSLAQVWKAHHDPELVKQWMLGPEGWTMPVCEIPDEVPGPFRYEWENRDNGKRFGFEGQILERQAPRRELSTEGLIGVEGPANRNEQVFVPQPGNRVRIDVTVHYASKAARDAVLGTGMVDGMEASYVRLDGILADMA
ncbi:MAG: SRPBCC family protein [Myxococcota bacterium]